MGRMRWPSVFVILFSWFAAGSFAWAQERTPFRTWTATTGAKIQARYLNFDGKQVTVERSDGKRFVFPANLLSPFDRLYARRMAESIMPTGRPRPEPVEPFKPAAPTNPGPPPSQGLPAWTTSVRDDWWTGHVTPEAWRTEAPKLLFALRSIWKDPQLRGSREERDFFTWFRHWRWLDLGNQSSLLAGDPKLQETFRKIGAEEAVRDVFLLALDVEDNRPRALEIFLSIFSEHPTLMRSYAALAAAFAVVFDGPFPLSWPHRQVRKENLATAAVDLPSRFAALVAAARKRELVHDPARLEVGELKFVVDHLLGEEELAWARQNVKEEVSAYGKTFASIQYDRNRLSQGIFTWPYGPYTFADIRKRGGICVDQAYFAAMAGKARGIPTLTFSGKGSRGGHAWFGFMKDAGKWETDCGRFAQHNYPVGNAMDPQTWKPITDDELEAYARGEKRFNNFKAKAIDYFEWACLNPEAPYLREVLRRARNLNPSNENIWRSEAAWVEAKVTDLEERRKFWEAWNRAFAKTVDLKIEGMNKLASAYEALGNPGQADKIRKLIVSQNRGGRADLALKSGQEQLMRYVREKDWNGADRQYQSYVRDFSKFGGELYYQVVRPYVSALSRAGEASRARRAVDFLKKSGVVDLGPDSIIAKDLEKLEAALRG